ncbi:chromosome segregation protein SMC [Salinisphaera sp. USBA-960]|uniref:chromosome segregation protein SMC n=1 Tax=Salinisphaera orenii TaxID=856731 RepID=UPI000DBE9E45|nr:chromosome segregation protein SMC [Salifodinibacter halophilus]NNC25548.1 chromosome segregation protein SMC [Salifodinibacter halophilus]
MRLSAIKLAGFKSFVEPTTIELDDDLTAVVGPNGCGKSNVIDAVRWVTGESSARQLRGQSLEDVIFAGSKTRKPVGRAAVELVFDNADGSLGGPYADYAEISIQREHNRRTGSSYRINGTRARRRDVQDLFLGTGLGGRASYALIGQGSVNRLIDAKPDQIRDLLEEAAGISKYKERRRETENRIAHTRDNLDRLSDRIEECEQRVESLATQAETASEYQRLQAEQQRVRRGQLALRWRDWRDRAVSTQAEQQRQAEILAARQADKTHADQRLTNAEAERQTAANAVDTAQTAYYDAQAEAQRLSQAVEHARRWREQREAERTRLATRAEELDERLETATAERERTAAETERVRAEKPDVDAAEQRVADELEQAEVAARNAERERDALFEGGDNPQLDLDSAERRYTEAKDRRHYAEQRLQARQRELDAVEVIDRDALARETDNLDARQQAIETETQTRAECASALEALATRIGECERELASARDTAGELRAEHAAETRMKNALTGGDDDAINAWLDTAGVDEQAVALAERVTIEAEWQTAVERVLGELLRARLVPDLSVFEHAEVPPSALQLAIDQRTDGGIRAESLATKLSGPAPLIAAAETLFPIADVASALARRSELSDPECFITPDGALIGPYALALPGREAETDGVIARERAIEAIEMRLHEADQRVADTEAELGRVQQNRDDKRDELAALDQSLDARRQALQRERDECDDRRRRADRAEARQRELESEISEARQTIHDADAEAEQNARRIAELRTEAERFQAERERCQYALTTARDNRDAARRALTEAEHRRRDIEARISRAESEKAAAESRVAEARRSREAISTQLAELSDTDNDASEAPTQADVDNAEAARAAAETRLRDARHALDAAESACAEARQHVSTLDEAVAAAREAGHTARTELETAAARRDGFAEQLAEIEPETDIAALADAMDAAEDADAWQAAQNKMSRQIEALGNVNLAAIDEHAEAVEQHRDLQSQHADLDQALATLNTAIEKIDRETRTRLKSTFDQVNEHFDAFFNELFGGGEATLERTESDWLVAGIQVIARPPGKPRVALAMLSGGEKTLTALALLFALFELNPAPFCMLDEVDAPLDDANVERFCRLIERMAERVQFVMITHNKTTMERPRRLHGVTMAESGVSRLVSVDIDAALAMAE